MLITVRASDKDAYLSSEHVMAVYEKADDPDQYEVYMTDGDFFVIDETASSLVNRLRYVSEIRCMECHEMDVAKIKRLEKVNAGK